MNIVHPNAVYLNDTNPYAKIELCGRTCYKSEDNITIGSSVKFVQAMVKNNHLAMLEHSHIYMLVDKAIADDICDNKFITITYAGDQAFVSGSFRAFLEMLNTYKSITPNVNDRKNRLFKVLSNIWPEVFDTTGIPAVQKYNTTIFSTIESFKDKVSELFTENANEVLRRHIIHTIKITCDRGISHEYVRHRIASFAQESTRYCVDGSTKLKFSDAHSKYTIEELYNRMLMSKNDSWKRTLIRQFNEDTGELQYTHITNIFKNGIKPCIKIKTKLGYELICTNDHEILTSNGYVQAGNLIVGNKIYVNGTDLLYKNKEWLYNQYITLNKTWNQISDEFNLNVSTLKKWAAKLEIPKKPKSYFNIGREPWNKSHAYEAQIEALRKYHHCGRCKDKILKEDTSEYYKYRKNACEICGNTDELDVYHIDENRSNNFPSNLMTLCKSCHMRVRSKNLKVAYEDDIVSIESVGERTVYDLEVKSNYHNYVANGIIVHNCNYSKEKFGNNITVIKPIFFAEGSDAYNIWKAQCESAEKVYFDLLTAGATAQEARAVLPNSLKTELVITATEEEWQHIINLRYNGTTGKPHPQMIESMELVVELLRRYSDNRLK